MAQTSVEDVRELAVWDPPLGVISVYLEFDPGDREGAWRTRLRNGLEQVQEQASGLEHERRMAVQATVQRIAARFENQGRDLPRGEAGFVEVTEGEGTERWWSFGVAPGAPATVALGPRPLVAPLVDLAGRCTAHGVVLVSAERVRALRFAERELTELADWELSVTSLDWRERKSGSGANPGQASSSGHDRYRERLEHNRERFLGEAAKLAAGRLHGDGLDDALLFGPAIDVEHFVKGLSGSPVEAERCEDADLISVPAGQLIDRVLAAAEQVVTERDRAVLAQALGETEHSRPGALGRQDTAEALEEGRAEHLVLAAPLDDAAEPLVRAALASGAAVTVAHGELAERLAVSEGVAAVLRY